MIRIIPCNSFYIPIPAGVGNKKFEIILPLDGTLTVNDVYEVEICVSNEEKIWIEFLVGSTQKKIFMTNFIFASYAKFYWQ